jgi:hypothetical protein
LRSSVASWRERVAAMAMVAASPSSIVRASSTYREYSGWARLTELGEKRLRAGIARLACSAYLTGFPDGDGTS